MEPKTYTVKATDGTSLVMRFAAPEGAVRGVICLVHGLGDYGGCFSHLINYFKAASFAVLALDLHGNGSSEGPRGHIADYEILYEDISLLLNEAKSLYPSIPVFLYGHSLGGNLVLNYELRRKPQVAGVIASSPWLELVSHPVATRRIAKLVNRIKPDFILNVGIDAKKLSHDPEFIRNYEADTLVHGYISAYLLAESYRAGIWAVEHANEFSHPLLLMHGGSDEITSYRATERFFHGMGEKNAVLKIWDGDFHSLHNELNRQEIFDFVLQFIASAEEKTKSCEL